MKWLMGGVVKGTCTLVVEAETRADAIKKFVDGEYDLVEGSEEWESVLEVRAPRLIEREIQEDGR